MDLRRPATQPRVAELRAAALRSVKRQHVFGPARAAAASPRAMRRRPALRALALAGCGAFESPQVPPAAPPYLPGCDGRCAPPTTDNGDWSRRPGLHQRVLQRHWHGARHGVGRGRGARLIARALSAYHTSAPEPAAAAVAGAAVAPQALDASDYPVHVVMPGAATPGRAATSRHLLCQHCAGVLDASMSGSRLAL